MKFIDKISKQIDDLFSLVDESSVIIPIGRHGIKILVDKDNGDLKNLKYKIKDGNNYIHVSKKLVVSEGGKEVSLGRYIMGCHNKDEGLLCDHINRNTLDNRRCNLRLVSPKENAINKSLNKLSTTGIKKVCYYSNRDKGKGYVLEVELGRVNGKRFIYKKKFDFECHNLVSLGVLSDCISLYINWDFASTNIDKSYYTSGFIDSYMDLYGIDRSEINTIINSYKGSVLESEDIF